MSQTATQVTTVDIREAETQLLRLLALALKGDEVVITKDNTPLARLVRINYPSNRRVAGLHKGAMRMHPDFNAPVQDVFEMDAV